MTAGYDMGWQRRSSSRAYNSFSGHGTFIGKETGMILDYGSKVKNCKQCEVNTARQTYKEHDCRMNWAGSSKAMEAALAVDLLNNSKSETSRVSTLICDEDATAMAKVKDRVPFDVTKQSDMNHIKKTIGNALQKKQSTSK